MAGEKCCLQETMFVISGVELSGVYVYVSIYLGGWGKGEGDVIHLYEC